MFLGVEYEKRVFENSVYDIRMRSVLFKSCLGSADCSYQASLARPDHRRAFARIDQEQLGDYQVDKQQPRWDRRASRCRALRYRSSELEPDSEISDQAKPEPFGYRFPRARVGA